LQSYDAALQGNAYGIFSADGPYRLPSGVKQNQVQDWDQPIRVVPAVAAVYRDALMRDSGWFHSFDKAAMAKPAKIEAHTGAGAKRTASQGSPHG
jgi:hypothetical protein